MADSSAWRSEVPEGWWPIYDALLADLLRLDPAVEIAQAKEKFGELRVYLEKSPEGSDALIDAAERQSRKTCQRCSAPGELMVTDDGLYATVCNEHAQAEGFRPISTSPIVASFRVTGDGTIEKVPR